MADNSAVHSVILSLMVSAIVRVIFTVSAVLFGIILG